MASLYEVNKQLTDLYESMIDPETGEVNEELYEAFGNLQMEKTDKVENIACWIKNLLSDAEAYKAEAKVFTERQKKAEALAERLKTFLRISLDGEKIKTDKCEINWRHTKPVECTLKDISVLPARFLRYGKPELNRTEVKKAIEDGETVEGCSLVEKLSMSIK